MPPSKSERVELHAYRIRDTFNLSAANKPDANKEARKCSAMLPPLS